MLEIRDQPSGKSFDVVNCEIDNVVLSDDSYRNAK